MSPREGGKGYTPSTVFLGLGRTFFLSFFDIFLRDLLDSFAYHFVTISGSPSHTKVIQEAPPFTNDRNLSFPMSFFNFHYFYEP